MPTTSSCTPAGEPATGRFIARCSEGDAAATPCWPRTTSNTPAPNASPVALLTVRSAWPEMPAALLSRAASMDGMTELEPNTMATPKTTARVVRVVRSLRPIR